MVLLVITSNIGSFNHIAMRDFLRTTPFGQFLRFASRNALLRYPDEIDSTLWRASVEQGKPSSVSPKMKEHNGVDATSTSDIDGDIVLVGWYGPHDAEVGRYQCNCNSLPCQRSLTAQ